MYEDSVYKPEGDVYMSPEIVFMGNNYKSGFPLSAQRIEMVVELRKKYGKRFQVSTGKPVELPLDDASASNQPGNGD